MENSSLRDMLAPYERNRGQIDERIRTGIERHRKGDVSLRLTDGSGQPLPGVRVALTQKSHDFGLGCNLFMLDELETAEKNETYKRLFAETFNMATLPFYWRDLEPEEGKPRFAADSPRVYRRPAPDLCLDFCKAHGIMPKLHNLNIDGNVMMPDWVPRGSAEAVKGALTKRFAQIAERYADRIPCVEVTNEALKHRDGCTPFYEEDDYISWSYRTARRYFPHNELVINEGTPQVLWKLGGEMSDAERTLFIGSRSPYYMLLQRELAAGTPIDAIGIQYHFMVPRERAVSTANTLADPLYLYRVLDKFAEFGLPLQITEITLPAYSNRPEDEEVQAQLTRLLYSVFFSHPALEAAIYWNLPDGYAWRAEPGDMTAGENYYYGGLLRFDLSEKPAFRVLRDLFHRQWRTECVLTTDGEGRCAFRGFYGEYEAALVQDGRAGAKPFHLQRGGPREIGIQL